MKIPLHIAEKLLLLSGGESIADSSARHPVVNDLVSEGILFRKGRIKKTLHLNNGPALQTYLQNRFSINNLTQYIEVLRDEASTRADLVSVSSDSKLKTVRTFKGFLVNSYSPIQANLNDEPILIQPTPGTFTFVYDFEKFLPLPDITIVGIENPENFRHIEKQTYLFANINPLFVCRYPQSQRKDMIKWLQSIPNKYVHFGDFDFAGIGIYLHEYKKHLKGKASFFVPAHIDDWIKNNGNKKRYDVQKMNFEIDNISEKDILSLIASIHRHKKGLDQEVFIGERGSG
ncbi:MAG: hypothetical protein K9H64_19980 [Bacteroidales bacterium]|nr:hypothetical protein [Bacteroidales bacterium]MCF8458348.1 hypothetical protein [Bacteroidales bacterium]